MLRPEKSTFLSVAKLSIGTCISILKYGASACTAVSNTNGEQGSEAVEGGPAHHVRQVGSECVAAVVA